MRTVNITLIDGYYTCGLMEDLGEGQAGVRGAVALAAIGMRGPRGHGMPTLRMSSRTRGGEDPQCVP